MDGLSVLAEVAIKETKDDYLMQHRLRPQADDEDENYRIIFTPTGSENLIEGKKMFHVDTPLINAQGNTKELFRRMMENQNGMYFISYLYS